MDSRITVHDLGPRREKSGVTLLQLSDLHFTSKTKVESKDKELFLSVFEDTLLAHLREQRAEIDLVVVTGDLVDNASHGGERGVALRNSRVYLEGLCSLLGITEPGKALIVIPGNHDYRWTGLKPSEKAREDFRTAFKDYLGHRLYPLLDLFVGCFDSNVAKERVEWARGWVDVREFTRLRAAVRDLEKPHRKAYDRARKLALVHHHPMPVPRAEDRKQSLLERVFFGKRMGGAVEHMLLKNSGTVLLQLMDKGFQAVLHGHYHQDSYWRPITSTGERSQWLEVVGCRSLGKDDGGGYGFNLITLRDEGDLTIEPFSFTRRGSFEGRSRVKTATYEDVCAQRWKPKLIRSPSGGTATVSCQSHSLLWEVTLPGGTLESVEVVRGLKVDSGELESLRFFRESSALTMDRFETTCLNSDVSATTTSTEGDPKRGGALRFEHIITFQPPLTQDTPVNLKIKRTTPGVMFNNSADAAMWGYRKSVDDCSHLVVIPTKQLSMRMLIHSRDSVPPQIRPGAWRPYKNGLTLDSRELQTERLTVSTWEQFVQNPDPGTSDLTLSMHLPITGRLYGFEWDLLSPSPQLQSAENVRIRFWQMVTPRVQRELLQVAGRILQSFLERHKLPQTNAEVALLGWASGDLQRIASGSLLQNFSPRWGRDIAGAAFRSGKPISFVRKRYSGHTRALDELPESVKSMIAAPLGEFDGAIERYRTVVLLVFASGQDFDGLSSLADQEELKEDFDLAIRSFWRRLRSDPPISEL